MTPKTVSPSYARRGLLWLVTATVLYLLLNGAQIFETALIAPSWTAAPPASLAMFQGEYRLDFKSFWIAFHSVHEIAFLLAIIFCWRVTSVRRWLLVLLGLHLAVRGWTVAYFAPTVIEFQQIAASTVVDPALVEKASAWRNLNYLRVGIFMTISLAQVALVGKLAGAGPRTMPSGSSSSPR